jgi:hypothetical protein
VLTSVTAHLVAPGSLGHSLFTLLSSLPPPFPTAPFSIPYLDHLIVADTPLRSFTTATARRFLDAAAHVPTSLDWSARAISRFGLPLSDIWSRLWRGPTLPAHRQTWYKLLFNFLALGARIESFQPDDVFCPFCPKVVQTTCHFLVSCPTAQLVWREFAAAFDLPRSPSLLHRLYSWPSSSSFYLGRAFGYRLQAGHAVALHLLWVANLEARAGTQILPAALPHRFRFLLARHFSTLRHSLRWRPFFSSS